MITEGQQTLMDRLIAALSADERIAGIWLEGSLARGEADRYSDIDLHALVDTTPGVAQSGGATAVQADLPRILATAGRVVFLRTNPGTTLSTGIMADGARFDVLLETPDAIRRPRGAFKVVFERRPGALAELQSRTGPVQPHPERVAGLIAEFWRAFGLLPVVLGRGELLVAYQGHGILLGLAAEIAILAQGTARQTGAKRLNPLLPPETRTALESAIPDGRSPAALVEAQLRLADLVAEYGRACAQRYGFDYPSALEQTVRAAVAAGLASGTDHSGDARSQTHISAMG